VDVDVSVDYHQDDHEQLSVVYVVPARVVR
jgi:hypothetical protein